MAVENWLRHLLSAQAEVRWAMALKTKADQGMSQMRQRPQKSQRGTVS